MQTDPEEIYHAAINLPEAERLALVARLMATIPEVGDGMSVDDPDFVAEIERRFCDVDGSIPWSELRSEG